MDLFRFDLHHRYCPHACVDGCFARQHGVNVNYVIGVSFSRHKQMFGLEEKGDYSDCGSLNDMWDGLLLKWSRLILINLV